MNKIKILLLMTIFIVGLYFLFLLIPGKDSEVVFEIKEGDTFSSLSKRLKEEGLIKSELMYKIYIKTKGYSNLKICEHTLNKNMNLKELGLGLSGPCDFTEKFAMITFNEGINIKKLAKIVSDNTSLEEEAIFNKMEDKSYLEGLIEKYWFLTEEILEEEIYYPLDGYLFPNTYQFYKDDITAEDVFSKLLNEFELKLEPYKEDIENSEKTIHELITLASIIELEASFDTDRRGVAGVFYNRLENNWSLGSDVTTYYGAEVEMADRDLYVSEINELNAYNTRHAQMAGKLPVGPICNPSLDSIDAVLNPTDHDYFFFVADKFSKTYFTKTNSEHERIIRELKEDGKWFEY